MKKNNICIPLSIPEHYLSPLIKLDEGKDISLEKRILIIIADYINRKKTNENTKENY